MSHWESPGSLHFLTPEEARRSRNALLLSMGISTTIMGVEIYGAIRSNSLALLSDSFHILTDISAHLISLFALKFTLKDRNLRFTFGYIRLEILAAFLNSLLLIFLCVFLIKESIERLASPQEVHSSQMLAYSLLALCMNSLSTYVLYRVSKVSINLRSAYLHALGDLLGTLSVVVGALLIKWTNFDWLDSIFSLFIVGIIARATYFLLRESVLSLLEASPDPKRTEEIRKNICRLLGYEGVLDLRHWNLSSGVDCVHLRILLRNKNQWESIITRIHEFLKEEEGIAFVSVEPVTKESRAILETFQSNPEKMKHHSHSHSHSHSHDSMHPHFHSLPHS